MTELMVVVTGECTESLSQAARLRQEDIRAGQQRDGKPAGLDEVPSKWILCFVKTETASEFLPAHVSLRAEVSNRGFRAQH